MLILFLICFKLVNRCETTTQKRKNPSPTGINLEMIPNYFVLALARCLRTKAVAALKYFWF
jgi:hypothetical protein